jgi:hypothetical protein
VGATVELKLVKPILTPLDLLVNPLSVSAASDDGIRIKIGYNPRVMNDTKVTPKDLKKEAPRKVEERMLDIW